MISLSTLLATVAIAVPQTTPLEITLKNDSPTERQTKQQLERLLKTHDLTPWLFTKKVIIEDSVIPHSHPVLTLSTRHVKDDELCVSTFVHEQLHWWVVSQEEGTKGAVAELKAKFPNAPTAAPDGANGEQSTYEHIIVCFLEGSALRRIYGEFKAWQIISFWASDHYRWVYRKTIDEAVSIAATLRKFKLFPPPPKVEKSVG